MIEGLRSLMDVVVVMNAPNTEGFEQIRSEGSTYAQFRFCLKYDLGV